MISADFIPEIKRFPVVDSTNTKAKAIAKHGAKEGTVIVAETQTAGRGRGDHQWTSPAGGLYFSVLLFPQEASRATDLSILAGVAVTQAVKEILPKMKKVSVKWPNDCLVEEKKIGGILCESLSEEYHNICVVGVGLNVNLGAEALAPFQSNKFPATSFANEVPGGNFDLEKILNVVLRKIFTMYALYQQQGFEQVRFLWERNCQFLGKKVELKDSGTQAAPIAGKFVGIDDRGALVLSNDRGEQRAYHAGEITCYWP